MAATSEPRVLIVAENVSAHLGGEAFLPLHYFRVLRARGIEAFVLTHSRVQRELEATFPKERDRLFYVPNSPAQTALWRAGTAFPARVSDFTFGGAVHMITQLAQRRFARRLVRQKGITVVHEPTPVSPRLPSAMYDLGVPVVIGPLNGGMRFPPAFQKLQGAFERQVLALLHDYVELANRAIPGKRRAAVLLVANPRTRAALPKCVSHVPILELAENGVDLRLFNKTQRLPLQRGPVRFAFVGRLVDWKAVDLLLQALAGLPHEPRVELELFGDGPERKPLEALAGGLGLQERVRFHGFVPQAETARRLAQLDGLILPSLYECGGAVVLEAMAAGLPVIATRWGGPADYVDRQCGILVEPDSREVFMLGLRQAIQTLAEQPELRRAMGAAGRAKVEREYDWERKVDRMLEIYAHACRQVGVVEPLPLPPRPALSEHSSPFVGSTKAGP